ncbi:A circularly permuted ATPgrasp family protein [Mycobacterium xenopi 3993]|nr:A circularly permuted ATPgrasp family protein [Mycobacterium xenopi 3993]
MRSTTTTRRAWHRRAQPWRLDGLPLLVSPEDWATLEAGVVQRSRLLDAILVDLYGPQRAITSGVLPPSCCSRIPVTCGRRGGSKYPAATNCSCTAAMSAGTGPAVFSSTPTGRRHRRAPATRWPTVVSSCTLPRPLRAIRPRPTAPFAQALRLALIEAAPETAEDPVVVVLSPGIHSETAFDQAYLASVLGFPLVESADLVVRDGTLWMRSLGTLKRVDVVLRRVDADYADPLDLRSDSQLGWSGWSRCSAAAR